MEPSHGCYELGEVAVLGIGNAIIAFREPCIQLLAHVLVGYSLGLAGGNVVRICYCVDEAFMAPHAFE